MCHALCLLALKVDKQSWRWDVTIFSSLCCYDKVWDQNFLTKLIFVTDLSPYINTRGHAPTASKLLNQKPSYYERSIFLLFSSFHVGFVNLCAPILSNNSFVFCILFLLLSLWFMFVFRKKWISVIRQFVILLETIKSSFWGFVFLS